MTLETRISDIFHSEFMNHPSSISDPALALDFAREAASNAVPRYINGTFDDEKLTFTVDVDSAAYVAMLEVVQRLLREDADGEYTVGLIEDARAALKLAEEVE